MESLAAHSDTIDRSFFQQFLELSETLLKLQRLHESANVWQTAISQIRDLFDAELASLFLVDDEPSTKLRLAAASPQSAVDPNLILEIGREHAAKLCELEVLNPDELSAPLKNRKGRLLGLLRIQNRSVKQQAETPQFTTTDGAIANLVASHLATIHEKAATFASLRSVIDDVQTAKSSREAIARVVARTLQLMQADESKLYLWDRDAGKLQLTGSKRRLQVQISTELEQKQRLIVDQIWQEACLATKSPDSVNENVARLHVSSINSPTPQSVPEFGDSMSVVLHVHKQPIGILHLTSLSPSAFNYEDRLTLESLSQNVAMAIQSMRDPAPATDLDDPLGVATLWQAVGHYHSIVRNTQLVMWRKDINGRFTWVNDAFCKSVGKKRSDIIDKTDHDLFDKEHADKFKEGDKIAIETGKYEDLEERFIDKNGIARTIHVVKTRITDSLGNHLGTQGCYVDATRNKFRKLFNDAPVAFHELDKFGQIIHVNHFETELLGYTEEEMIGKTFSNFASDRPYFERILKSELKPDRPEPDWHPINLVRKDQRKIPVLIRFQQVTDPRSEVTGLLCVIRELGAGAEIEKALRNSDSRFLAKIRDLEFPVFCVDTELKVTFANDAHLTLDQKKLTDFIGKTGEDLYEDDYGRSYNQDSQYVLRTGEVLDQFENHLGNIVRVLKFPIRDSSGKIIIGVQGIFWGHKDHKDAMESLSNTLADAMAEYKSIVQNANEGIYQGTLEGEIRSANPRLVSMLKYDSEHALVSNKYAGIERFADPVEKNLYFAKLNAAKDRSFVHHDYQLKGKEETLIWVTETVRKELAADNSGQIVGFIEDIDERRRNAEKLKASLDEKEEMLTMLAHQLRSPVWQAFERANQYVINSDPNGSLQQGNASDSVRQLAAIRGLIRKTRGVSYSIEIMSRLVGAESLSVSTRKQDIQPKNLLKYAIEWARDAQMIKKQSSRFMGSFKLPYQVPSFTSNPPDWRDDVLYSSRRIHGNPDLIEQCIGNLIDNAFKYSLPSSTIEIHCAIDWNSATLAVKNRPNRGMQITGESQQKCVDKHWRSDMAPALDADGTGLGLWFVNSIMKDHGGRLVVSEFDGTWNSFALVFQLTKSTGN